MGISRQCDRNTTRQPHRYDRDSNDFVLRYATEDNTGAITDGWLDLTGPLKPIRFVRRQLQYYLSISNTLDSSQDVRGLENTWKEQGPRLLFDEPPQDELLLRDVEQGPLLFCMICRVLHSTPIPLVVALLVRLEDAKKKNLHKIRTRGSLGYAYSSDPTCRHRRRHQKKSPMPAIRQQIAHDPYYLEAYNGRNRTDE